MGPTISQFPASAFPAGATGVGFALDPHPQRSNPTPQAVKLNKAQTLMRMKL